MPALMLVLSMAAPAGAQTFEATLQPNEDYEDIARSLDLSGDTLAVGALLSYGAVDIFVRSGTTWSLQAEVEVPVKSQYGKLGRAVALDGGVLLAGDPTASDGSWSQPGLHRGAAHVFRRSGSTWSYEAELEPSGQQALDLFGQAVAVDGDVAVVGAPQADPLGSHSGRVWVFRHAGGTWLEEASLVAPDGGAEQRFGESLALDGATLVIGAPAAHGSAPECGAAYAYVHDGASWTFQQKVVASDGVRADRFAAALSLDGDRLAVGVPRRDSAGQANSGAVALFQRAGGVWLPEAWLAGAEPRPVDNLGASVALQGDVVIAGAPDDDTAAPMGGAVHVWRRIDGTWQVQPPLLSPLATEGDIAGVSVSLDAGRAVVGCLWRNGPALGSNGVVDVWSGMHGSAP